ncbi:PAS domain-containing hybrid sensor histidine kinase/response regulator [Gemmatirosa kalamazoonensis]|nr:PAS domain-containing hybrid sensor histidine kinase/response regulator [Gemmatirosa kalamazoonensis]
MPPPRRPLLAGQDLQALLVEHLADHAIFALDRDGRVVTWTAGARRMKGWDDAEILGQHFSRFYTPEDVAAGLPERLLAVAAETGTAQHEGWRVRKDGSRFWADVVITALRDERGALVGFAKVTRDRTERIEAAARAERLAAQSLELEHQVEEAQALAEENERLYAEAREAAARLSLLDHAVQAASESIVIATAEFDDEGPHVLFANPACSRLTGRTVEALVGLPLRAVLRFEARDGASRAARARLLAGQPANGHIDFAAPDGGRRVLEYRTAPIREASGALRHLVVVLSDVTERVRVEEQYRQAQKMEALGQLAGGIAHDFNNLLTVIGANAAFLDQAIAADDARHTDVDEIRGAVARAGALTRQLLAFSRRQPFAPRELDLNDVVQGAESLLRRVLGENIELVTRLADGLPAIVADRGQLEQVLLNLVVNARDAMPDGGRLEIATFAAADGGVTLRVRDSGVGMSAETQSRIFEPFFTTKEPGKGTGLGLSTVYGVVGRLGGRIMVESAPGRGATFTIQVPPPTAAPAAPAEAQDETGPSAGRGEVVLLVEDEEALRRVARRALVAAGYHVVDAPDGPTALATAATLDRVDLLATDVVMPVMRGSALAARLRERFPALRVLYISGYTGDVEVERERSEPGTRFLEKPYDGNALARAARALLDA